MDSSTPFSNEPVRLPIEDVFDLHSVAPREVRDVVREYVREAHAAGFRQLRIVHGRGIGVQRNAVREVLTTLDYVVSFGDAPGEAGGWGATVIRLR